MYMVLACKNSFTFQNDPLDEKEEKEQEEQEKQLAAEMEKVERENREAEAEALRRNGPEKGAGQ